jgi:transposase-like protein
VTVSGGDERPDLRVSGTEQVPRKCSSHCLHRRQWREGEGEGEDEARYTAWRNQASREASSSPSSNVPNSRRSAPAHPLQVETLMTIQRDV